MSEPDPRAVKLLDDIYTSAKRIVNHLQDETLEGFLGETGLNAQDITARRLTIIGEAAATLLKKHPEFCARHPEIPLRPARGMRNILVHEYDGVDWEAVWDTVRNKLPCLIDAIAPFLSKKP